MEGEGEGEGVAAHGFVSRESVLLWFEPATACIRHSRAGTELTDNLCRITRRKKKQNIRNRKQNRTIILGRQGPCKPPPQDEEFQRFLKAVKGLIYL